MYRLASSKKTKVVIELGTSLGINTLYLSAAYPEAKIYTFEGCPQTAELARKLFKSWHIQNIALIEGNINETLPQLLSQIQQVDLVYQDANHRYAPTLHYYDMLYERATQESIFIVDDIYWSSGMHKAWKNLISRTEVTLSIDLFDAGFLFFKPSLSKQRYTLMF